MENEAKVVDLNEHRQVMEARRKITDIVHNQEFRKFLSEQTLNQYEEYVAAQKGAVPKEQAANSTSTPHADSLEGLLMMFDHLSKEWEAAKLRLMDIKSLLKTTLADRIANEADLDFLVENLILTGEYNLTQENAVRFKQVLVVKIENMRKDRKTYDELSKHRFTNNLQIKKLEASKGIQANKLDSFLKASLPERRAFLKELRDALLKEEALEAYRERNKEKMVRLYKQRLDGYYFDASNPKGCIGEATYNAYANECEDLDLETLRIWHQELKNQMAPRVEFWKELRSALSGPGLTMMESQMHKMGLGALKKLYPEVRKAESERLCSNYDKALLHYIADGTVGRHSALEFQTWIRNMPLTTQYQAEDRLEEWEGMGKYKALRAKIKTLDEDQRVIFELNMNEWGYKECIKELGRLGITPPEEPKSEEAIVKNIQDVGIREAILETADQMEEEGNLSQFLSITNTMLHSANSNQYDQVEFDDLVANRIKENAEKTNDEQLMTHLDKKTGKIDAEEGVDLLEQSGGAKVTEVSGLTQIETPTDGGEIEVQVVANNIQGVERFVSEASNQRLRSESAGGHDGIAIALQRNDGSTKDLNLKEVRVLQEVLAERRKAANSHDSRAALKKVA